MACNHLEKARSWARQFVPRMVKEVDAAQTQYRDPSSASSKPSMNFGGGGGNYDDNANLATDSNMEQHIQRGDWSKVYELAEKQGPQVTQRYITYHVRQLCEKKDFVGAMAVLASRGVPVVPSNFPMYSNIVRYAFQFNDRVDMKKVRAKVADENTQRKKLMEIYGNLRKFLHQLVSKLYETDPNGNQTREFEKMLYIAHFVAMRETCGVYNLKNLFAKASTSLLRYIRDIPADMAFYNAGQACADAKMSNLSFMFMNRFVDVCDWIEEPGDELDNGDFMESDIPTSADISPPKDFWVDDDSREEAREWVIDKALGDDSMSQQLPDRRCEFCGVNTYEAGLRCHNCGKAPAPCIVTGYPVMSTTQVACRNCKKPANRSDWNKYVMKTKKCPWCESLQEPLYV
jgi:intraflagellar transport protein 172